MELRCVPWVGNLSQNFLQVVQKLDKVRQAFEMFPQWVRLGWSVALSPELDGPHERRHSLQQGRVPKKVRLSVNTSEYCMCVCLLPGREKCF